MVGAHARATNIGNENAYVLLAVTVGHRSRGHDPKAVRVAHLQVIPGGINGIKLGGLRRRVFRAGNRRHLMRGAGCVLDRIAQRLHGHPAGARAGLI